MDLFRRIFGKAGEEEIPLTPAEPTKNAEENNKNSHNTITDELDSSTHPVDVNLPQSDIETQPAVTYPNRDGVTQPLNQDNTNILHERRLNFGQSSDVGLVRNNNQDAMLSFYSSSSSVDDHPDFGLFVVADGMGGHHDGEKASAIVTRVISTQITQSVYLPMVSYENNHNPAPITEALIAAVRKANLEVIRQVPEGGTTVTAVAIIGDLAHIVHVGDSRAYIITAENGLEQITRDHSLVQRLIELEQITPQEALNHPQSNVLYRAIGQSDTLEVDAITRRLPGNCRLLICSDGLWGQVEEEEILDLAISTPDPQKATDDLVKLAKLRGGRDNITAILLRIS